MKRTISKSIWFSVLSMVLSSIFAASADTNHPAHEVIEKAIQSYGGKALWDQKGTLVVHEIQNRYVDETTTVIKMTHFMDTLGKAYKLEINDGLNEMVYGWDGHRFWATLDGSEGDDELLREAQRVISNSFYRFSLPFILDDHNATLEYQGDESVSGFVTQVVKIVYAESPGSQYWHSDDQHGHAVSHNQDRHGGHGDNNHGNDEVYYFHFDKNNYQILKIYFSHHGDDNYETFLFGDYENVEGIAREHTRRLVRASGEINYDSNLTGIEFRQDPQETFFRSPYD